ncbi:hypothetical protein D3C87_28170 [compost metagenome]
MKKNRFPDILLMLLIAVIMTACTATSEDSEKVDDAATEVQLAKEKLEESNRKYAKEVNNYRVQMQTNINDNKLLILKLKEEKSTGRKEAVAVRNAQIDALEKQNEEMEVRMNRFKNVEDKDQWKEFKEEFDHDMDELGKAFKGLSINNVKQSQ